MVLREGIDPPIPTEGVGVVGGEEVINWGLSGPMLRASGIQWDLWKVDSL
ncbi:hypothetical protein MKX03_029512 [Papaver bracteatum]|nr:hypothetical protein MKX03_029512 [Papaver bracteatum]